MTTILVVAEFCLPTPSSIFMYNRNTENNVGYMMQGEGAHIYEYENLCTHQVCLGFPQEEPKIRIAAYITVVGNHPFVLSVGAQITSY